MGRTWWCWPRAPWPTSSMVCRSSTTSPMPWHTPPASSPTPPSPGAGQLAGPPMAPGALHSPCSPSWPSVWLPTWWGAESPQVSPTSTQAAPSCPIKGLRSWVLTVARIKGCNKTQVVCLYLPCEGLQSPPKAPPHASVSPGGRGS